MNMKRLLALLLVGLMLLSVAGCGNNNGGSTGSNSGNGGLAITTAAPDAGSSEGGDESTGGNPAGEDSGEAVVEATYTLNEALGAMPDNWSVHSWETNADSYVFTYTETPLVDIGYVCDEEGNENFQWVLEMAESIEDVTATWEGAADWGIDPSETGRVWRIKLNPNAVWGDEARTPINADTYIYSMQQCLSPEMKNYRANSYYQGESEIIGAYNYYYSGSVNWVENVNANGDMTYAYADWTLGEDGQYYSADGAALYFNLYSPIAYWMSGYSLKEYYEYGYVFEEVYTGLDALANEEGYVPVTDETIALLYTFTGSADWGFEAQEDLANYVSYQRAFDVVGWDTVGLLKEDEYTILYLCANPISQFYFYTALTTPWLVYEPLYEAGKSTEGGLVTTNYGTSLDTYMSYGPYYLASFETDKQMVFEKNDAWYGYTDGKHEGQYQTTRIVTDIVVDHDTELQLFNSGKLDSIELTTDDMDTYRFSDNLLKTDETYTYRFFIATDYDNLVELQKAASSDSKKVNKVCLSYSDFRQAMAYSLNRDDFVLKGTAGSKAALGVLNSLYYYNIEFDSESIYRNTDQAKAGICAAYGVTYGEGGQYATLDEAYAACTGYDVDLARALFQSAYDQMVAAGDWTDDMVIEIDCAVTPAEITASLATQNQLIQSYLDDATAGTGFEGKVTLTYTTNADRYGAVMNGEVEMGYGAWGGAAFYPFSMMQCYCDPDYTEIQELCGFDPTTETATLIVFGEEVTKTYTDWSRSIIVGGEYDLIDIEEKLSILAQIEQALIQEWNFIVLCSLTSVSMYSYQVEYATTNYNIMYGYGGVRHMTYNYSDAEWEAYVSSQGTLDYT